MDHERAFLQAIREQPDDDAHRLIYADWLEEQGGAERTARAAFIRAQCRLAALSEEDPLRDRLEDEAVDLLAEHEREWTQPLHGIAADWLFSRGFIERITIGAPKFLTHAERLFDLTPLRSLHFLIHPRDVPRLAACAYLQGIETLDFRGCHLNDRALQQLLTSPYLKRLRALDLTGNGINTPGVQALVQSPVMEGLRWLDLSRNLGIGDKSVRLLASAHRAKHLHALALGQSRMTADGLSDLLHSTSLTHLSELSLADVHVHLPFSSTGANHLGEPQMLRRLRRLDISETSLWSLMRFSLPSDLRALHMRSMIGELSAADLLAGSPNLTMLTLLDLQGNRLGSDGARVIADAPVFGSLTHLDLRANNIRDRGAKALAESPHLKRLRVLDAAENGMGGPGLSALATSGNLDGLHALRLGGNFIGVYSVRALAESPHLIGLTSLDLSDACLEEDAARVLASSPNFGRLHRLVLNKNLLGDAGARALAQSPHLQRLTELDLRDNRIGKAGAEALAASKCWRRLRKLDLRANVFTDTQEALLRERFGDAVLL